MAEHGPARLLAEAVAEQPARQLPLLPVEELDALPVQDHERDAALRRRGGRRKGQLNRQTAEWRDLILGKYGSPLEALAETIFRPVADLAAELGCTKLEAFTLQQRAATELAPYVHGKMPVDLNVNGGGLVQLNIINGAAAGGETPLLDGELLKNQGDE